MTERSALGTRERIVVMLMGFAISMAPCGWAHASKGQTMPDVRCAVVGLRMVQMTTPQQRSAGMILAAYYLGLLDGQLSDAESERLIESEAGKMTLSEFRADATRCGKALAAKGREMQKISIDLSRKTQGQAPPK